MSSKASRKRQKRLAFTPLPSSSPASKGYPKQIRDRAAAVVLEGSPSPTKRRKAPIVVDDEEEMSALPTPPDGDEDSDRPIRPTSTQRRRAKQQRLDFSSTREPSSFDPPVTLTSSARRSKPAKGGLFSSQAQGQIVESSDEESDESDVVVPSQRKFKGLSKKSGSPENGPAKRTTRSSAIVVEDEDEDDEIAVGVAKPVQQAPEASDDDDDMPTTMGTQRRRRQRRTSNSSFIDNSSPPPTTAQRARRKTRLEPSSDPLDSPPGAIDSDDDLIIIEPSRKRRRQDSSEEGDEAPKTPMRRLKQKRQMTDQEKLDLDEDLEFLKPSSDEEDSRRPRDTQSAQKNARQRALAKLKQKRGQSSQMAPVEEDEENEGVDPDSDAEMIDDDEVEEITEAPPYTSSRSLFKADEEDENFIDENEEDNGPLGVPDGIPLRLTRYGSMKAKELFRWAVDWFVQRKINPAFSRNDEIYNITFQKLDDEVQGLSLSKFTSSAWVPSFVYAMQARPDIAFERLDRNEAENMFKDKCEACNRSGHPPTYRVQFQGKIYHRDTLDEVTNPDDDDEEDEDDDEDDSDDDSTGDKDDDKPGKDHLNRDIVPANTFFYLGKFCKANTEAAHSLYHWRYHLAAAVEYWLEIEGYLTAEQVTKRDKMSTAKRGKRANKIANRMEAAGETQKLWKMFRDNIDAARNSKHGDERWGQ